MRVREGLEFIDRPIVRLYITLFLCVVLMAGLLFSKAIMSIATISLAVNAVLSRHVLSYLKTLLKDVGLWAIISMFILFVLSGINSTNMDEYLFAIRTKLPLLLMPLGLLPLRQMGTRQYFFLLTAFTYITTTVTIVVFINALLHFDTSAFGRGGTFETPINHVRYSLIVALSIATGCYTLFKKYTLAGPLEKGIRLIAIVFLAFFLHVLAVRSGIIAFYLIIAYAAVYYFFIKKQRVITLLAMPAALFLFMLAFKYVPSLKVKKDYMQYEWYSYTHGEANSQYGSDMGRWRSYVVAWHIYKAHPLWGVGIGDIQDSTNTRYNKLFPTAPSEQLFTAHNQYLFVLSAMGTLGGGAFILCLFIPVFYKQSYKDFLFMSFQLVMWMSFIFEAPMQEQTGLTLYWLFTLLIYNYIHRDNDN